MDLRKIGVALIFIGIVLTIVFIGDEKIFVPALTITVLRSGYWHSSPTSDYQIFKFKQTVQTGIYRSGICKKETAAES